MSNQIGEAFRKAMEYYKPMPVVAPEKGKGFEFIMANRTTVILFAAAPGEEDQIGIQAQAQGLGHPVLCVLTPLQARHIAAGLIDAAEQVETNT